MSTNTNTKVRAIPLLVETYQAEQFPLFSNEEGGGVLVHLSEVLKFSESYSKLYEIYINRLVERLSETVNESDAALQILTRRALVPLVHCFLDRMIRVKKAIDISSVQLAIPLHKDEIQSYIIEDFESAAVNDPKFNQLIINTISGIWALPKTNIDFDTMTFKTQVGFRNNLFSLYGKTPYRLIKKLLFPCIAKIPYARLPAISLANAQGVFFEHGFYAWLLENITPRWVLRKAKKNLSLRDDLFRNNFIDCAELDELLYDLGLNKIEQSRFYSLFEDYLCTFYPSSLLESISENMEFAKENLIKFKKKVLLSAGGRCSRSTYILAAAKQNNFTFVNLQHGGHYGYFADLSTFLELEYPGVDQFISWGWTKLPNKTPNKNMTVIPLPSPWLSERKRYWKKLNIDGIKEFDVLLMPNMVKRFPAAPQGALLSRIDLIKSISTSLITLVQYCSKNKIKMLHKPYNTTTVGLLDKTLKEMELVGGSLYSCEKQLDKGLTYSLLNRCHVVVWDQPGTGFLECLSSGIPTMIIWMRDFSQEEEWVKPVFDELEDCGIVHSQADTLINQIIEYKKSPVSWMNNAKRKDVVSRFCRQFAWTEDDWPIYWKNYLNENVNAFN